MKLASWNCRGVRVEGPTLSYISYLIRLYELDVVFLQETICKVHELVLVGLGQLIPLALTSRGRVGICFWLDLLVWRCLCL